MYNVGQTEDVIFYIIIITIYSLLYYTIAPTDIKYYPLKAHIVYQLWSAVVQICFENS